MDAKDIKKNEKEKSIQNVAKLLKELIGERSIRRAAEDTGVAASYITGILKERYLPSADILRKLSAPEAKPQGGVSLADLMVAAGYQTDYIDKSNIIVESDEETNEDANRVQRVRRRHEEVIQYNTALKGMVYSALEAKGFKFFSGSYEVNVARNYRADMAIRLEGEKLQEWWFEFSYMNEDIPYLRMKHMVVMRFGRLLTIAPSPERKISIITNSIADYEYLKGLSGHLAYKGNLSVIYADVKGMTLMYETWLSHYDDKFEGEELTLV